MPRFIALALIGSGFWATNAGHGLQGFILVTAGIIIALAVLRND